MSSQTEKIWSQKEVQCLKEEWFKLWNCDQVLQQKQGWMKLSSSNSSWREKKLVVWIRCLMHWSCMMMKQNEGCPASCTNTCCTTDFCCTFLWKEQSQGWDILTHPIWYMSVQSSICLELEDTLPASFTERVTSLRWALQPWEAGFHSKFSFSSWLQLPSFLLVGALHFLYNSTAQRISHTCPQPGCGAAIIALDSVQGHQQRCASGKKDYFFSKNTKYNKACSAQDLQEHLAGEDGTSLLSGITWPQPSAIPRTTYQQELLLL